MRDNKLLLSRKGQGVLLPGRQSGEGSTESEEDKSEFLKLRDELKQGLYGGFFVILRHNEQATIWKFIFLYFFLMLQMLSYSFNEAVSEALMSKKMV
jgi:hypothetical protein